MIGWMLLAGIARADEGYVPQLPAGRQRTIEWRSQGKVLAATVTAFDWDTRVLFAEQALGPDTARLQVRWVTVDVERYPDIRADLNTYTSESEGSLALRHALYEQEVTLALDFVEGSEQQTEGPDLGQLAFEALALTDDALFADFVEATFSLPNLGLVYAPESFLAERPTDEGEELQAGQSWTVVRPLAHGFVLRSEETGRMSVQVWVESVEETPRGRITEIRVKGRQRKAIDDDGDRLRRIRYNARYVYDLDAKEPVSARLEQKFVVWDELAYEVHRRDDLVYTPVE